MWEWAVRCQRPEDIRDARNGGRSGKSAERRIKGPPVRESDPVEQLLLLRLVVGVRDGPGVAERRKVRERMNREDPSEGRKRMLERLAARAKAGEGPRPSEPTQVEFNQPSNSGLVALFEDI